MDTETLRGDGSNKARSSTQKKISTLQEKEFVEMMNRLSNYLTTKNIRELQKKCIEAILNTMKEGGTCGIIKLPTGVGKTRLFAMLLRAIGKNGLILIPRVALYNSTVRELQSVGFEQSDIHLLKEQDGGNIEDKLISLLMNPDIDWSSGRNQCIMTYQSLTLLIGKNPAMIGFIQSHFGVVIEDEAHRGLGDKTKRATTEIVDESISQASDITDIDEYKEVDYEKSADKTVSGIKYNYKFTATPDLFKKSVVEDGEYIYYGTVEDGARTGAIILPQYISMGSAYTKEAELENWTVGDIEALAEGDNFLDESGTSIRDKIINTYIKKKKLHNGILPGVAFASTIKHAEQIVEAYQKKGIRAMRVTSDSSDILPEQAIDKMNRGELDVMVTVTKVSEGFDYPPLACAMWFCPVLSPAKMIQGNGRIMRMTESKKPPSILDRNGKIAPSLGAYIIGPSVWYGRSKEGIMNGIGGSYNKESIDGLSGDRKSTIPRVGNFYELLIEKGEIDINSLGGDLRDHVDISSALRCELGEEISIEGVVYVGVNVANEVMGVKGQRIIQNLKKNSEIQRIPARQNNGMSITLIPKSFIESLKIDYICEVGESIKVNDIMYVGVARRHEVMGIKSFTILRNLGNNPDLKGIPAKQPNGSNITLVPKSFIESLRIEHLCELGEEKKIGDSVFIGVAGGTNVVLGVKCETILHNLQRKEDVPRFKGRQKGGFSITLVPKSFIESLQIEHVCEPGEEKKIKGVSYIGVTNSTNVMGLRGESILRHLRKNPHIQNIGAKQKNGSKVTLVPKSFIESLNIEHRCESGGEIELDGITYIGVTRTNEVMGVKGQRIIGNLDKSPDIVRFPARQNNGMYITLVPKSFIESLKVEHICEPGEEKIIDEVVYVGVAILGSILGMTGDNIIRKLRARSDVGILRALQKNGRRITLVPKSFIVGLKK